MSEEFRKRFALLSHNAHKSSDPRFLELCNLVEAWIADEIISADINTASGSIFSMPMESLH